MIDRKSLQEEAMALLADVKKAALGTLAPHGADGFFPFVTLVEAYFDKREASILLLLSDLSEHARNIAATPHASLLIDGTAGMTEPLSGPRLTLTGTIERSRNEEGDRQIYIDHFPNAAGYASFADFHPYRFSIEAGYFVAGFGRVAHLNKDELR